MDPWLRHEQLHPINFEMCVPLSLQGLVPALAHGDWGCYESTVLMEYVDDISEKKLLPEDPKQKAHSRLWADHISRNIVPTFYRYLQAQEVEKQAEYGKEFEKQVNTLLEAADPKGPFFTVCTTHELLEPSRYLVFCITSKICLPSDLRVGSMLSIFCLRKKI
ncbi:hypothetical protein TWF506_007900 [Arthrobotrys conoides]|uniref:GST N-terminal domain-containing protein n=1 Tax=Arthrobotrys conoides TaxID=74498 RepID=A0AAN8NB71_9PEZI